MGDLKIITTYEMTVLKIKRDHGICFLHNPCVSIIKKPWATMNCKENYLQYTYVAFSICLAIYSLLFCVSYAICSGSSLFHSHLVFFSEIQRPCGQAEFWAFIWLLCYKMALVWSQGVPYFVLSWVCWEL